MWAEEGWGFKVTATRYSIRDNSLADDMLRDKHMT